MPKWSDLPQDVQARVVTLYATRYRSTLSLIAGASRQLRRELLTRGDFFERFMDHSPTPWRFVLCGKRRVAGEDHWQLVLEDGTLAITTSAQGTAALVRILGLGKDSAGTVEQADEWYGPAGVLETPLSMQFVTDLIRAELDDMAMPNLLHMRRRSRTVDPEMRGRWMGFLLSTGQWLCVKCRADTRSGQHMNPLHKCGCRCDWWERANQIRRARHFRLLYGTVCGCCVSASDSVIPLSRIPRKYMIGKAELGCLRSFKSKRGRRYLHSELLAASLQVWSSCFPGLVSQDLHKTYPLNISAHQKLTLTMIRNVYGQLNRLYERVRVVRGPVARPQSWAQVFASEGIQELQSLIDSAFPVSAPYCAGPRFEAVKALESQLCPQGRAEAVKKQRGARGRRASQRV